MPHVFSKYYFTDFLPIDQSQSYLRQPLRAKLFFGTKFPGNHFIFEKGKNSEKTV
jgi:hypothetical protein